VRRTFGDQVFDP
jgi:dephospho-CoA kinase